MPMKEGTTTSLCLAVCTQPHGRLSVRSNIKAGRTYPFKSLCAYHRSGMGEGAFFRQCLADCGDDSHCISECATGQVLLELISDYKP